ncbi:type II toxin-antitoxin system MqsA family antitoxin [Methylomonas sp. AM2-LC]|uniref:type II toxin-antitoxin system MqsA family antitoxin n=1 Tax=Methylomonas sp. AM2-LC TaxID=3153301 RepID=UPI003264B448
MIPADQPYTYKGVIITIEAVTGDFCPVCDEAVLDMAESKLQFNKQVNAAYVDPGFIANVRKKLRLDQREAAEFIGRPMLSHAMRVARPSHQWPW